MDLIIYVHSTTFWMITLVFAYGGGGEAECRKNATVIKVNEDKYLAHWNFY